MARRSAPRKASWRKGMAGAVYRAPGAVRRRLAPGFEGPVVLKVPHAGCFSTSLIWVSHPNVMKSLHLKRPSFVFVELDQTWRNHHGYLESLMSFRRYLRLAERYGRTGAKQGPAKRSSAERRAEPAAHGGQ